MKISYFKDGDEIALLATSSLQTRTMEGIMLKRILEQKRLSSVTVLKQTYTVIEHTNAGS